MKNKVWIAALLSVFLSNATQATEVNVNKEIDKVVGPVFRIITDKARRDLSQVLNDHWNSHLTPVKIKYLGKSVFYQHQRWKIKHDTVCINHPKIQDRSTCQVIAKSLFQELCKTPSVVKNHNLYPRYKNMYCNAAGTFKPMIVQIKRAKNNKNIKDQKCNALIVKAMNNPDYIIERNKACR